MLCTSLAQPLFEQATTTMCDRWWCGIISKYIITIMIRYKVKIYHHASYRIVLYHIREGDDDHVWYIMMWCSAIIYDFVMLRHDVWYIMMCCSAIIYDVVMIRYDGRIQCDVIMIRYDGRIQCDVMHKNMAQMNHFLK